MTQTNPYRSLLQFLNRMNPTEPTNPVVSRDQLYQLIDELYDEEQNQHYDSPVHFNIPDEKANDVDLFPEYHSRWNCQ